MQYVLDCTSICNQIPIIPRKYLRPETLCLKKAKNVILGRPMALPCGALRFLRVRLSVRTINSEYFRHNRGRLVAIVAVLVAFCRQRICSDRCRAGRHPGDEVREGFFAVGHERDDALRKTRQGPAAHIRTRRQRRRRAARRSPSPLEARRRTPRRRSPSL